MADSQKSVVSTVAIIAIVILVGLVFYFVWEETNDDIEIDLNLDGQQDVPVQVDRSDTPTPEFVAGPVPGPVFHSSDFIV